MAKEHKRQFRGVWVPARLLEALTQKEVTSREFLLILQIESLVSYGKQACFASNEYLAKLIGVGESHTADLIQSVIRKGWVIRTGFDGRKRFLITCFSEIEPRPEGESCNETPASESKSVGRVQEIPVGRVQEIPVGRVQEIPVGRVQEIPVGRVQEIPVGRVQEIPVATLLVPNKGLGLKIIGRGPKPSCTGKFRSFTDLFCTLWKAKYGKSYPWQNKDGPIASKIWKLLGEDFTQSERVLKTYFSSQDKFYTGHPLGKLLSALPEFMAVDTQSDFQPSDEMLKAATRKLKSKGFEFGGMNEIEFAKVLEATRTWVAGRREQWDQWVEADKNRMREEIEATGSCTQLSASNSLYYIGDILRPAGVPFWSVYGDWIISQVSGWKEWKGGLQDFWPGAKHFQRFIICRFYKEAGRTLHRVHREFLGVGDESDYTSQRRA